MGFNADNRLSAILSEIAKGDKVADIGCDHGKIANSAVRITGNPVVAVDISKNSLLKTQRLARALSQEDKVNCIVGDGLKPLDGCDADTAVIAGLGGHEIVKILDEAPIRLSKYILVPHQHASVLRAYLATKGYGVIKDYIVEADEKFYPIIVAVGLTDAPVQYSDFEMLFGKSDDSSRQRSVEKRKEVIKSLIKKARGNRLRELMDELEIIEHED